MNVYKAFTELRIDMSKAVRTRDCTTCGGSLPLSSFPKKLTESTCDHEYETCTGCWHNWIDTQLDNKTPDQVSCIQCRTVLNHSEIKALAAPSAYQKYLDLGFRSAVATHPDFHWCLSPSCESGQIHSEGDIFRCITCGFKMCVHCNVEWHGGESCKAFQDRPILQKEEEKQSIEALKKYAKQCPSCERKIQKRDGCDHMTCHCGHEFCWLCLVDYDRVYGEGNSAHERTCRHWRPPSTTPALNTAHLAADPECGDLEGQDSEDEDDDASEGEDSNAEDSDNDSLDNEDSDSDDSDSEESDSDDSDTIDLDSDDSDSEHSDSGDSDSD